MTSQDVRFSSEPTSDPQFEQALTIVKRVGAVVAISFVLIAGKAMLNLPGSGQTPRGQPTATVYAPPPALPDPVQSPYLTTIVVVPTP